ncbi:unnamed protein product [Coffea canephora]|uniref:DH200=94 genomic scaffold, scaffold_7914 n=1 Tax=Coffea canephora TaxID=49390 RepID=A0A068VMK5_COFCA|nr:unnamed protein product [Coffea canephora]
MRKPGQFQTGPTVIAWEDLRKAKAEAAKRKLEMKLEKKRSSSMDKIMNKLGSISTKEGPRNEKLSSFSGCFTCHAF